MTVRRPPSEAERTLAQVVRRGRLGLAVVAVSGLVFARQTGLVDDDVVARGLIAAVALAAAAAADEAPERLGARIPALAVVGGDLGAAALAAWALLPVAPLAPAILLWPIFASGFVASGLHVLLVAALATLAVYGIAAALGSPSAPATAGGWGAVYFLVGAAHGEVLRRFRDAQRVTETTFARSAELARAMTAGEVAEVVFSSFDEVLGASGRPAALFLDERGDGGYAPVAARGIPVDAGGRDARRFAGLGGADGIWLGAARARELRLPDPLATQPFVFALPLADARRTVGYAIVGAGRATRLAEEAQRGLARLAAHASSALERIRLSGLAARQRSALLTLLDVRDAGRDAGRIAEWTSRIARELSGAELVAVAMRDADGGLISLTATAEARELTSDAAPAARAALARRKPVLIADAASEDRFALGPRVSRGALVSVPVQDTEAVLLAHRGEPESFSSDDVQLLILLADQLGLALARAQLDPRARASSRSS